MLPIFVDRTDGSAGSGAVLRFCPAWRASGGTAVPVDRVDLRVEHVLGRLTARGRNTWRALVSTPLSTLAPDESRAFEVRAHELVPLRLTLRGRHDAAARVVVLTGTLMGAGEPVPHAEVTVHAVPGETQPEVAGWPVTDADGRFTLRYPADESTAFSAFAGMPTLRVCREPSSAPAGCVSETFAAPPHAHTFVQVPSAG